LSSRPAPKRAAQTSHSSSPPDLAGRVRRILLGLLYLTALSLLIVWEYRERLDVLSSDCELRDQVKSSTYNRPYERFLDWASSGAVAHVVTLAIPSDLEEVQQNLCLGREYMADVLRALAPHNPSVVVIDKFYSAGSCASAPASTQDLIRAVETLKVPVVIGESTRGLEHEVANSCLVRTSQLDFRAPNVSHGLTRVNSELERLPLRWLVLSSAAEQGSPSSSSEPAASSGDIPKAEFGDSLSFAAVKAYDPAFAAQRKINELVLRDDHAYANLAIDIPKITTTQLLCAADDDSIRKKWSLSCSPQAALPNLTGRVVVVGSETSVDEKLVLGKHIWGFELQARYIETLLSGDYLGFLPIWSGLVVFALFVFLIEGLPTILIARRPRWRKLPLVRYAYPHRRYLWVVFWAIAIIAVSAFVTLALRYLPPLLVYGDILLVAVTRLLFFLAESAEDPFLHAHTHRKVNAMSTSHSHNPKTAHSTNSAQNPKGSQAPPSVEPFVPGQPAEPEPVPTSSNRPGSEGGSAG
jgi:CHASE2 domain